MSVNLRKIRNTLGMPQRPVTDGMALPQITTREELDELREIGIQEMNTKGHSRAYVQWTEALRRGADRSLPSMHELTGLATDGAGLVMETTQAAMMESRQFEQMDARLEGLEINGQPASELDPRSVLEALYEDMVDFADGPQRDFTMQMIEAVNNSTTSSITSATMNMPTPSMTVHVESEQEQSSDPYVAWRESQMNPQGLDGLAIGDGYGRDGLKNMGGGGGSYSVAHDAILQQAIADQYDDGEG